MTRKKLFEIDEPLLVSLGALADEFGIDAYVVGGYVRDLILGKPNKDVDVMVIGDPVEYARKAAARLHGTGLVIFEKFRTAQMTVEDLKVEIVGARKENYESDSRKPLVQEATLEEDLSRRDFTINAMALGLNRMAASRTEFGELVDPFCGVDALSRGLIDTPLDPVRTFDDDPLRIMRALRFAGRFEFELVPRVGEAVVAMKDRLTIVSQERITDEFMKILSSPLPSAGLKLMQDTGIMEIVFPEISLMPGVEQRNDHHHKDVFLHTLSVVDRLAEVSDNLWLRFAGLVHDIAKPDTKKFVEGVGWTFHGHDDIGARRMKSLFRRLRLPMDRLPYVEKLVRLHLRPMALAVEGVTDSAVRRLLFEAGDDFEDLMKLCRADITSRNRKLVAEYTRNYDSVEERAKIVEEKDRIRNWRPPIDGEEIMVVFGLKPSRAVGLLKKAVESAVLDGKIPNDHDAAVEFLRENGEKILSER